MFALVSNWTLKTGMWNLAALRPDARGKGLTFRWNRSDRHGWDRNSGIGNIWK